MNTRIIHAAVFTPPVRPGDSWGLRILFWGAPGVGKSKVLGGAFTKYGMPVEVLSPGARGEGAFGVTPTPDANCEFMKYPPPAWVKKLSNGGVVFLDEINTAPPALQPYLMCILQDNMVGDYYFGEKVRVMAAANPLGQAANGFKMAPPVANRMGHLQWESPTPEEWSDYMLGATEDAATLSAEAEERRVLEAWPAAWAMAVGQVTAFIIRRPDLLHKLPKSGDSALGMAWPSHRSFESATKALASATVHGLDEAERETFMAAFVGEGAASEFFGWSELKDLPNPVDLLDEKIAFKPDRKRLDRNSAIIQSCAALVTPEKSEKRQGRAAVLWKILGSIVEDGAADITVPAMRALCIAKLNGLKEARPVLAKAQPVMTASGMK